VLGGAASAAPLCRSGVGEPGVGVGAVDIVTAISFARPSRHHNGPSARTIGLEVTARDHSEGVMTSDARSPRMVAAIDHRAPTSIVW
jgi:hypothetical protein